MSEALVHRGPDDRGEIALPGLCAEFRRLSIVDLSPRGSQPMRRGPLTLLFNGEIYNHIELRRELEGAGVRFESASDTEVLLRAYERWGTDCLERLIGMFAIAIFDQRDQSLFLARDRFGVKPLYLASADQRPLEDCTSLAFASEVCALQAVGIGVDPNPAVWARFLTDGAAERGVETFWVGIERLGAGEMAIFKNGQLKRSLWYDLATRVGGAENVDRRSDAEVSEELEALLKEAVGLRFRADVPVGINLSGGLDSSLLLTLTGSTQAASVEQIHAFTFITGDQRYDELPWVEAMVHCQTVGGRRHPLHAVSLTSDEVPALATAAAAHQREPIGGAATLAYGKVFAAASQMGIKVLLDGQGVDETWAGYDYYQSFLGDRGADVEASAALVQGSVSSATRPQALAPDFAATAASLAGSAPPSSRSRLLDRQLFDLQHNKLPRALRYNDRVSMRASVELREPFLDHRLVELGLRQPAARKVRDGVGKALPRELAARWLPPEIGFAPKRPLQTPQREWLRGDLKDWTRARLDAAVSTGWLKRDDVERHWLAFVAGDVDNAFFVWQWIDLGLLVAE